MVFSGPIGYGNFFVYALVLQCMVSNGVLGCNCTNVVVTSLDVIVAIVSPVVADYFTLFPIYDPWWVFPLNQASLRCDNSFWSNSGLVQTVFAP